MKSENATMARNYAVAMCQALREAHTDAIESENQFAEMVLCDILEKAHELETRIARIVEVAK